jgi:hypothetical protein
MSVYDMESDGLAAKALRLQRRISRQVMEVVPDGLEERRPRR